MSLLISLSHNTELATAQQRSQSWTLSPTVPNASCRNGTYTTPTWSAIDTPIAVHERGCDLIDRLSVGMCFALAARPTTVDEINRAFTEEAVSERYRGVLGVTTDPVVSSDLIKDSSASVVDLGMTQVVDGDLVRVMSWYDNEWGYSSQMVREALRIANEMNLPTATA